MYLEVVRDKEGKIVELTGPVYGLMPQSDGSGKFCQVIDRQVRVAGIEAIEVADNFAFKPVHFKGLFITMAEEVITQKP